MPNTNNPTDPQGTEPQGTEPQGNQGSTYTPPATQEELNRIIENRLRRERDKYADYDQLKEDSKKLGEVEKERDVYKSRLEEAEKENGMFKQAQQRDQWAQEVSDEHGIPKEALRGETKEELLAHAETLKKYIGSAPYVQGDGKTPATPAANTAREQFAAALEGII